MSRKRGSGCGATAFAPGAEIYAGNEAVLKIAALGLELVLSEIYAGITFA